MRAPAVPAVYRYICPDGRSYVGAVLDIEQRKKFGFLRTNARLKKAFLKYPPETFRFEVLEILEWGGMAELHQAEQRHIDRLRSSDPKYGFNMTVWNADGRRWHHVKVAKPVAELAT
jgi:hypothetical protein